MAPPMTFLTRMESMTVTAAEDYEYGIQYYWAGGDEWRMARTNHFEGWYPSKSSRNNAFAQLRATRYGWRSETEYRKVRRPVGGIEIDG